MKNCGFTILEITLGITASAIVIFFAARVSSGVTRQSAGAVSRSNSEDVLSRAVLHILQIGRLSGDALVAPTCHKTSAVSLECAVNFSAPPPPPASAPPPTIIRFVLVGSSLLYQHQVAGGWETRIEYPGVANFEVCSHDDLVDPTHCTIPNSAMTQAYQGALAVTAKDRFVRFRLTPVMSPNSNQVARSVQASFFTRNPPPPPITGVYRWGTLGKLK